MGCSYIDLGSLQPGQIVAKPEINIVININPQISQPPDFSEPSTLHMCP